VKHVPTLRVARLVRSLALQGHPAQKASVSPQPVAKKEVTQCRTCPSPWGGALMREGLLRSPTLQVLRSGLARSFPVVAFVLVFP
jgi:hypothetical protein